MKRTQKLVTWSIVILVVLVVLLMLMSNLRRSSRVVLPDTSTSAGDSAEQTSGGSAIQVVEVTPETVQAAIATLHRPEAYSRSVTVEYLWNGGSSTSEITVSASGGWSRTDRTLPDGQTRHAITNGETTYIWYNSETDVFTGPPPERSHRTRNRRSRPMRTCWPWHRSRSHRRITGWCPMFAASMWRRRRMTGAMSSGTGSV